MTTDLIHDDGRDVPYRGSETCGDIDVMITRSVCDGKTHAGGYICAGGTVAMLYMGPGIVT